MAVTTCSLNLNLYEANPKCTRLSVCVYKGFYVKAYEGKNGTTKYYLCAQGGEIYKHSSFTAPENALVYLYYSTGSRSHTYHSFTQWFVVKQGSKASLSFDEGGYTSWVEAENLQPLPELSDQTITEAEAEILNLGLTPSQYDPVRSLYHYVVKQLGLVNLSTIDLASLKPGQSVTIPFAAQPQQTTQIQHTADLAAQISALRAEIEKKRKELEELEKQLQALLMKQGLEQLKEAVV